MIAAGLAVAAACGSGSSEPSPVVVGVEDPKTDDPRDVVAGIEDGDLVVRVDGLPEGSYLVSLIKVDGSEVVSTIEVQGSGADETVLARLDIPDSVVEQWDLVEWSIRVESLDSDVQTVYLQSLMYALDPYDVRLEGPSRLTQGKQVAYRIIAEHPVTHVGLPDREVTLLIKEGDDVVESYSDTTDDLGAAAFEVEAPGPGTYEVEARAQGSYLSASVAGGIEVETDGQKVLLTTDKPIYKPGQTMHLRSLALGRDGNRPVEGEQAVFEVEDAKGNKVFKKTLETDEFGIASSTFVIGNIVNEGTYKVRAIVGEVTSEKTVQVEQYALPKFDVDITTDKSWYGPGETVSGVVNARYFFGKPVAEGSVTVEAATVDVGVNVYQQVMGQMDENGRYQFSIETPQALVGLPLEQGLAVVSLRVTATDTAGQQVVKESLVRVAPQPLRIALVPEATSLVAGFDNRLNLFVTDPLGAPVRNAVATLSPSDGEDIEVETGMFGHAEVLFRPADTSAQLSVTVTANDATVTEQFSFDMQAGADHVLVRTDKALYNVGDTATINVLTTDDSGSIFVDWLNDGQAVDLRTLEPEDGEATFSVTIDESMVGENRIEAYIVDEDGQFVRAGRTIFARNATTLNVDVSADQSVYEPGAPAELTFNVTDEEGEPAVAALGVQIVDEAVFSLVDARPGLLKTYFELEDDFAEPSYQLRPPAEPLVQVLFEYPSEEAEQEVQQAVAEAAFGALGSAPLVGLSRSSWAEVVRQSNTLLMPFYMKEKERLVAGVQSVMNGAVEAAQAAGCDPSQYFCDARSATFWSVVSEEARRLLEAYDFWGNAYETTGNDYELVRFSTLGPDEIPGTDDDHLITVLTSDLDLGEISGFTRDDNVLPIDEADAPAEAAPGAALGGAAATNAGPTASNPEPDDGTSSEEPRVRSDFPETLYVNPAVITDSDGRATISLDMADSITEWRVSSLANSADGKLGSAVSGVTVFQDFFVDVNFPATLTRGDEIEFPIAVYNYLDEPQTVNLELAADDWYTPLGETSLGVELSPGEVKGVTFPVRVEKVGLQTLTVQGIGSEKSDAVARTVRVVPDGKQVVSTQSGSIADAVEYPISFAPERVAGSEQLYVNVFPTFLSQAVEGMDSMLRTPNGCFEQTTSSAWPNVLVTHYMQETDQITPEILARAEALMSAGYQRLLTFEHPGGGYSWFGTQDPAPFLSVTAFGLMEFSDMAKVHPVDEDMVARTRAYLLSQQESDGSWQGDQSEFFSFHTSGLRNTAFTLWALASSDYSGAETELGLEYVKSQLSIDTADPYTLALVANAMALLAPNDALLADIMDHLVESVQQDPEDDTRLFWDSAGTQTNFYGYGQDAAIATTALVTHAMLQLGGYGSTVNGALNYLTSNKDSLGNFGSTQATVWTLKTLLLAATKGTEAAVGTLVVELDGEPVETLELSEDSADVMRTVDMSSLATGDHNVSLSFAGTGKPSYSLVSSYHVPWEMAEPPAEGPLSVSISYDRTTLAVDETVTASVRLVNNTANLQNMALVTVGLPPGFEIQGDDFQPYLDNGTLSRWEVTGRQVILYVTELSPNAELVFNYGLKATMIVQASDGGASAYPYYEPERTVHEIAQILTVQ